MLASLSVIETRKNRPVGRLTRASKIYKTIISAIQEKKGTGIVSLDLRKIPESAADFFIICQAESTTQVRAICDSVSEYVANSCSELPYRKEGLDTLHWVLVDFISVVVHIMLPEIRDFYKLEEMWSDAPCETFQDD